MAGIDKNLIFIDYRQDRINYIIHNYTIGVILRLLMVFGKRIKQWIELLIE